MNLTQVSHNSPKCLEEKFSEVHVAGLSPKSLDVVPKRCHATRSANSVGGGRVLNGREGRTYERFLGLPASVVVTVLWLVGTMLAGTCALVVYLGVLGVFRMLAGA
jgi:hypothetical protein